MKTLLAIIITSFILFTSCLSRNCENGYVNNEINIEYYKNGQIKVEAMVLNCLQNGTYREYYNNGSLRQEGFKLNGIFTGKQMTYDQNGLIVKNASYDSVGKLIYSDVLIPSLSKHFVFDNSIKALTIAEDEVSDADSVIKRIDYSVHEFEYFDNDFDYILYQSFIIQKSHNQIYLLDTSKFNIQYSLIDTIMFHSADILVPRTIGTPTYLHTPQCIVHFENDHLKFEVQYYNESKGHLDSKYFYFKY